MIEKKMIQLIGSLLEQTESGQIHWEAAFRENWFQVSFGKYTVQVGERPEVYVLKLFNIDDHLLEEMESDALLRQDTNAANKLSRLYVEARRQALGVESALDEILGTLGNSAKK